MRAPWQRPDEVEPEPAPRLVLRPGGSLIDEAWLQTENRRAQEQAKSAAARSKAREEDAATSAAIMAEHERVQTELDVEHLRRLGFL